MVRIFLCLWMACCSVLVRGQISRDTVYMLITNVNVWDGVCDSLTDNQQVLIVGNHIGQVASSIVPPEGCIIINGRGNTLIPGLSDAHVHLMFNVPMDQAYNNAHWGYVAARATKGAENFLMEGFTTVRDMGGPVFGLKQAIDEGIVPGPRIYPSGALISQTSGHGDMRNLNDVNPHWAGNNANLFQLQGWSYIVDGRPAVLNAVRENLRHGASQIKMMAGGGIATDFDPLHTVQFTPEELEAGVQAAADWGTYVGVHVYNPEGIMRALQAGVKSIEHGHMINDTAMHLIKEKEAFLVPQSYWVMVNAGESMNPAKFRQAQEGAAQEMELAKKYDVKLAFGTDVFGHMGVEKDALKEFVARSRWYTPVEVLKQATSQNAALFALSGKLNPYPDGVLGVIQPGAYADLLIYEGNPLENLQVVVDFEKNLKLIMKDGKVYKNELDRAKPKRPEEKAGNH